MTSRDNPLVDDRLVRVLLHEMLALEALLGLPGFEEHSRETCEAVIEASRRLAREELAPSYAELDASPPIFADGTVRVHPKLRSIYPKLVSLGLASAAWPTSQGGEGLPWLAFGLAQLYLTAGNGAAYAYLGLTSGAARLLAAFGTPALRELYVPSLLDGRATGTMALTEPHAGSSLGDLKTRATPRGDRFALKGSKVFISGGDHDIAGNIVHLVLARIDGAPEGVKGISLFAVPKVREDGALNDVTTAGVVHKIGWRAIPSVLLELGDGDDCLGHLVGEPHRGLAHMFQMMNEARLMVGVSGIASASVAFHEAKSYAQARTQGRTRKDGPPVAIIEHADVKRMLVRQKAIVDGGIALLATTSRYADLSEHALDPAERHRAKLLLELLVPIAKSFPAERGFEANTLAVQVFGGYGYSSEYPVEAHLRDQKLNSLHEGTTGVQGLDLLGRKAVAEGGAAIRALRAEIEAAIAEAAAAGLPEKWGERLLVGMELIAGTTAKLAARGLDGLTELMLLHSADYLEAFSTVVVAWQWLRLAAAGRRAKARGLVEASYAEGLERTAQYWLATDLPRAYALCALCQGFEDSYARVDATML